MTTTQGHAPKMAGPRRWLVGGVAAALATMGAVVVLSGPASADPITTYVAVGSDTTQDVINGIADGVGVGLIGSWDAIDPLTQTAGGLISPKRGCTMTRPNGSGQGQTALRRSMEPASVGVPAGDAPEHMCVDIARSSAGPNPASPSGLVAFVPFAVDAVAAATGPATAVSGSDPAVATKIVDANLFTKQNLIDLYSCTHTLTVGTTTFTSAIQVNGKVYDSSVGAVDNPGATPPVVAVHLKLPQSGSGTRNFWAGQMLIDPAAPPTCVLDTYTDSTGTHSVQEHDGSAFAADANALGPFSVAQFLAQTVHNHSPRAHNAVVHSMGNTDPTTQNPINGSGAGQTLNKNFVVTRLVYNVVLRARIDATVTPYQPSGGFPAIGFDATLANLVVGTGSRVCTASLTISNFGFATMAGGALGHNCGDIADPTLWGLPQL
jgi:hypothetical protein